MPLIIFVSKNERSNNFFGMNLHLGSVRINPRREIFSVTDVEVPAKSFRFQVVPELL